MVDSWHCLEQVVLEGMSQVSRRLEVGNHKPHTLNTQLSSGTSAGTFACPAGPYRNCRGEAGTKNEPNWYFVPDQKKGLQIDPHVSNLRSREFLFGGVQVHPDDEGHFQLTLSTHNRISYFKISFFLVETIRWVCIFLVNFLPGTKNLTIFVVLDMVLVPVWNPDPTV